MESSPSFVFVGGLRRVFGSDGTSRVITPIFGLSYLFRVPLMIFRGLFKKKQQAETKQLDVLYQSITHIMPYAQIDWEKKIQVVQKTSRFQACALLVSGTFHQSMFFFWQMFVLQRTPLQIQVRSSMKHGIQLALEHRRRFAPWKNPGVFFFPEAETIEIGDPRSQRKGEGCSCWGAKICKPPSFLGGLQTNQHRVCWNFWVANFYDFVDLAFCCY